MAGYSETMLQGLQGMAGQAMQQRRLAQQQQQYEHERRLSEARLGQQAETQRRMWQAQEGRERANQQRFEIMRESIAQRNRPPLKQGYMRGPGDTQTPVPGGPAWRELSSKHADDVGRLGAFGEVADAATAAVGRILDPKKKEWGFEPNFGGYNALATQYTPGPTQDTRNDLENLKSNLKAQGASLMRGVGGAPGSITEREWPILEKLIESISPLMSEGEATKALQRISQRFQGMKQRSLSSYKQEWGDSPFYKENPLQGAGPTDPEAAPQGWDAEDWKFLSPEEKAQIHKGRKSR